MPEVTVTTRKNRIQMSIRLITRNPLSTAGLVMIGLVVIVAILGPFIAPYNPLQQNLEDRFEAPSATHLLGTDDLGRDIFSRILNGASIDLTIALFVVAIAAPLGTTLGTIAGYFGGKIGELIMRITDIIASLPGLIIALAAAAFLGRGIYNAMLALALIGWPAYSRLARGMTLQIKEERYIEAARAIGSSKARIIFTDVFPLLTSAIVVQATMQMGQVIFAAASLGFMGVGARPPSPEWGLMISDGLQFISVEWWMTTFPGLAILFAILGFNLVGDAVRDILDVKLRTFGY